MCVRCCETYLGSSDDTGTAIAAVAAVLHVVTVDVFMVVAAAVSGGLLLLVKASHSRLH